MIHLSCACNSIIDIFSVYFQNNTPHAICNSPIQRKTKRLIWDITFGKLEKYRIHHSLFHCLMISDLYIHKIVQKILLVFISFFLVIYYYTNKTERNLLGSNIYKPHEFQWYISIISTNIDFFSLFFSESHLKMCLLYFWFVRLLLLLHYLHWIGKWAGACCKMKINTVWGLPVEVNFIWK